MIKGYCRALGCRTLKELMQDCFLRKVTFSLSGRLIFVNSMLFALPSYISIFKLSKWMINKIDKIKRAFLWKGDNTVSGFYYLVNWDQVCKSKMQGSLGIKNLEQINLSLVAK